MDNLVTQYKYKYAGQYGNVFQNFYLGHKSDNKNAYFLELKNNKNNNAENKNISYSLGGLILGSGIVLLMFSRGAQKNVNKYMNKLKKYFEENLEISTLENSKRKSKFYGYAIKKLNSFIKKSESINNITSIKDVLFMKLMYKTKPTKKIHKSISKFFENLSRKTVVKSYKQTGKSFDRMNRIFDNLDKYILEESPDEIIKYKVKEWQNGEFIEVEKDFTKKQLVEMAKGFRQTTNDIVKNFISEKFQTQRYSYIKEINSSLYSKFWNESFKDFWTKNNKFKRKEMWQTFIAAEQIKGDKTKLADNIAIVRNAMTYTNKDKIAIMYDYVKKLKEIIPPNDEFATDIVEKLEWFTKNSDGLKHNKSIFLKELDKLSQHSISSGMNENIQKIHQETKDTSIRLIKELINDDATGELQDMLAIYYKIAPFELSKSGANLALKKAVKSFDKSVNIEIGEFFDKVRDLELGSAPTDILTILVSLGLIVRGLNYATSDDQKLSVALKSGIPIAGGILTSIISATKLVSGGKSLFLGFLSAILLNQAGYIIDKLRLKTAKK